MGEKKVPRTRSGPGSGRRLLLCAVAFLALALLSFVGIRLKSWQNQRRSSRAVVLVNAWNPIDDTGFHPRLVDIGGGMQLDRSCAKALQQMLDDCRAAGGQPQIRSAYRSRSEQEQMFAAQVKRFTEQGFSAEKAERLAAQQTARPGTSEHELGLAVDILDEAAIRLEKAPEATETFRWLVENAWRYGFILRYPPDRQEITGAPYEPWHFRYVGGAAAWQIYSLGITLEEYSSLFYSEEADIVFDEAG